MAVKSSLGFPLAFFLLVSQMVVALGAAVDNAACEPVYAPPHSIISAPPTDAPVYPPPDNESTPPPPLSPPVSTPPPPPVSPPPATPPPPVSAPPPFVLRGCAGMCFKRCRLARPYRPCMRACGECCNKSLCVPGVSAKCDNWPTWVVIHGKTVACP